MKIKSSLLPLVVGIAAGTALGLFIDRPENPAPAAEPARADLPTGPSGGDLAVQLSEARAENDRLRATVERLESQPIAARPDGPRRGGFSFSSEGPPTPEDRERMANEMRPHMRRFIESRLGRYQLRLGLDDAQFQKMSDLMLLQQEQMHLRMMSAHELRANGGEGGEPTEGISTRDLLDMASEILSPEQFEEYSAILEEERASRNEMMATARLSQISSALKLSDEQKDAAYSLFYGEADRSGDDPVMKHTPESQKAIDEALGNILTKEQYESYQQLQQQQQQMMTNAVFIGG